MKSQFSVAYKRCGDYKNMEFLPNTCIECTHTGYIGPTILSLGTKLDDFLEVHVAADCWALQVGDEILFNSYNPSLSLLDRIKESAIRSHIIDNAHSALFSTIACAEKDTVIKIYMFGRDMWEARLNYSHVSESFKVSFYTTKDFNRQNMTNIP